MSEQNVMKLSEPAALRERVNKLEEYVADLQKNTIKNNIYISQLDTKLLEHQKNFYEGGFIYVGSPYSHPDPSIMERRYRNVMFYMLQLFKNRQWAYSPILHCHDMANKFGLPKEAKYWANYNFAMLSAAREFHVYCLPGWDESVGLSHEVAFWRMARERHVKFIDPHHETEE